jgi:hypothetical protein
MFDYLHRVVSAQTITPTELRLAGVFCLAWFFLDVVWFAATLGHWWGL